MLERFFTDPSATIVILFLILAILLVLFGLGLLLREMLESPWRERCQKMIEAENERALRLKLLAEAMARHVTKKPE